MKSRTLALACLASLLHSTPALASPDAAASAARSINDFGLTLHRLPSAAQEANRLTSPWSIQSALALTLAGAAGETHHQMALAMRTGPDTAAFHQGIAAIRTDLAERSRASQQQINAPDRRGGPATAFHLHNANRLFGQKNYRFESSFLDFLAQTHLAPIEWLDFLQAPEPSRTHINQWVETQTSGKIRDLIPAGLIDEETRMVLVNAIHFQASWREPFHEEKDQPFFLANSREIRVPGMQLRGSFPCRDIPGGLMLAIPYAAEGIQFLLFIPDQHDGLPALEDKLDPSTLAAATTMPAESIQLHLPAFRLEPPRILLAESLATLGMPSAFDQPAGSADFSRMASRLPNDYLRISEVVHQAMIAIDRHGTEAAAATAVVMMRATAALPPPSEPRVVRADRPFAFAIQHLPSGTCLFLGRLGDPR